MKNRTTVEHGMLEDLARYLVQSGWKLEIPLGEYEVLRARKTDYPRPLLIHDRTTGGCGYSIDELDKKVYAGWLRNRKKRGFVGRTDEEKQLAWSGKEKRGKALVEMIGGK